MNRLIRYALAMVLMGNMATGISAQVSGIPDGKRVIIENKEGVKEVIPMNNIIDMTIATVEDARVSLDAEGADEASIRVTAKMGSGCHGFRAVCYPASVTLPSDRMQEYIQLNGSEIHSQDGTIEYIDLQPQTEYTIAVMAYDQFDFPCDITTLTVATTAPAGNQEAPAAGSYLYADGTWSKELKTNKTPVAIIFSTQVSDKDRESGFTHGYAVALKGLEAAAWTTEADEKESGSLISGTGNADINDLDGRSHSEALMAKPEVHPAAAAAAGYGPTPAGASGWYLPSAGQMIAMMHNLGNLTDDSFSRQANGSASWSPEAAAAALTAVNAKLSTTGEGKYTPLGTYTWTSSEASVMSAYYLYCHPSAGLMLQTYYKDSLFDIRPVLAF